MGDVEAEVQHLLDRRRSRTPHWADSAYLGPRTLAALFGPGGEGAHADVEWASLADTVDCTRSPIETALTLFIETA